MHFSAFILCLIKVFLDDDSKNEPKAQIINTDRSWIKYCPLFDAATLPPPSVDSSVMSKIDAPENQSKLNPEFISQVTSVCHDIVDKCPLKIGCNKCFITGKRK